MIKKSKNICIVSFINSAIRFIFKLIFEIIFLFHQVNFIIFNIKIRKILVLNGKKVSKYLKKVSHFLINIKFNLIYNYSLKNRLIDKIFVKNILVFLF